MEERQDEGRPGPGDPSAEPGPDMARSLDLFIRVFLQPFLKDGRIDELERRPLVAAYLGLGIARIREEHPAALERRLLAALAESPRSPSGSGPLDPPLSYEETLELARLQGMLRTNELQIYREWLGRLQMEFRMEKSSSEHGGRLRVTPDHLECLSYFARLIEMAWRGEGATPLAGPSAAAGTPPPKVEAPPTMRAEKVTEVPWRVKDPSVIAARVTDLRTRAGKILAGMRGRLSADTVMGLAFDSYRNNQDDQAVFVDDRGRDLSDLWFVGDVHGDLLALEAGLGVIGEQSASGVPTIVFLGDLIDRGRHSPEVLLRVYDLINTAPERICLIAGNHSHEMTFDGTRFLSGVSPSDFTDFLNDHKGEQPWSELGQVAAAVHRQIPRALFLPDGLLAAHGGIPHPHFHPSLTTRDAFNQPNILLQFAWNRAHPRMRQRFFDPCCRDQEFGFQDFDAFCKLMDETIGFPVRRMVRGHKHEDERYAFYPAYQRNPMLTINTMGHRYADEWGGTYARTPCVARWMPDALPEVFRIRIDPELLQAVYPAAEVTP